MAQQQGAGGEQEYGLRLRELCERAQHEADFDRLALIVEEILSVISEQQNRGLRGREPSPGGS